MQPQQIKEILSKIKLGPSKWELDTITWYDRLSNPSTLAEFLTRIDYLQNQTTSEQSGEQKQELVYLLEMLDDMDESDIDDLYERSDEDAKEVFIEDLAKISAIEVITDGKLSFSTMNTACKLSPNDFILCAKRTQDLLNSIQGLVIKGETLSKDVAGA